MQKRFFSIVASLVLMLGCALGSFAQGTSRYNIIPAPAKLTPASGDYVLSRQTTVYAKKAEDVAQLFVDKINKATGYDIKLSKKQQAGGITLLLDKSIQGKEAYTLTVTPNGVTAKASTKQGLFYAMQSFLQLLPPAIESSIATQAPNGWKAAACTIEDAPRFEYRGTLIDVCRYFFSIEQLKKHIDVLSMYKINNIHLHLTEDQAWRIEIKKYPELTEIGAWRDTENGRYGGYYTQEELKDLVKYAEERFINIIPEFEMPGHELAAIAAYPWLSCREEKVIPRPIWGIEPIVMCPGKETTFQFLKDVVDEMVQIFPSQLFHIGGDEAPRDEWKTCPLCQKKIQELGYKDEPGSPKEAKLQSYVVCEMEKYLNKYGKSIIGWDEILEGGNLNKSAIVMSWRGDNGGIVAANAGHRVIMTSSQGGLYVDYYQGDPAIEPQGIGGYAPISKTYAYNPVPKEVQEKGMDKYIMGPQVNLWAEYLPNNDMQDYRLYPRLLALSEIGWTPNEKKNFEDFSKRLDSDACLRLKEHKVNFHIPLPEQPYGSCNYEAFTDENTVTFKTTRPEKMVYTLDGSEPNANSTEYTAPLKFTESATIKIATLLPCGIMSKTRTVKVDKQTLSPATEAPANLKNGLRVKYAKGSYYKVEDLDFLTNWEEKEIKHVRNLGGLTQGDYAAVATGLVKVEKDGVYYISSNAIRAWIDDQVVVDNNNIACKTSRPNGRSIALKAGLHKIKVVYFNVIMAGRPASWSGSDVLFRYGKDGDFKSIKPEDFYLD